jgi:hypothetical protein
MGIIDIDEDEDEEFEEERSIDREYPRLSTPLTHHQMPISETRQSTSNRTSSHSRSPTDPESQRIIELEQRVRIAERKAEAERRNREITEREVRDLQSSLYAPISDGGRKRKERSGEDDDLDAYLLQYAIKKSKTMEGDDDDGELERAYVTLCHQEIEGRYVISLYNVLLSRDLTDSAEDLSKRVLNPESGGDARSSSTSRDSGRRSESAAATSPQRSLNQQNRSTPSAFATDFWSCEYTLNPIHDSDEKLCHHTTVTSPADSVRSSIFFQIAILYSGLPKNPLLLFSRSLESRHFLIPLYSAPIEWTTSQNWRIGGMKIRW